VYFVGLKKIKTIHHFHYFPYSPTISHNYLPHLYFIFQVPNLLNWSKYLFNFCCISHIYFWRTVWVVSFMWCFCLFWVSIRWSDRVIFCSLWKRVLLIWLLILGDLILYDCFSGWLAMFREKLDFTRFVVNIVFFFVYLSLLSPHFPLILYFLVHVIWV
jgi:hypothetical protein